MITGLEPMAAGYIAAWVVRKGRRIGGRADSEVDYAIDTAMDRVHEVVVSKLGDHPALARLESAPADSPRGLDARKELEAALRTATDSDAAFAAALRQRVDDLATLIPVGMVVSPGAGAVTNHGEVSIEAHGGVATQSAVFSGTVNFGVPPTPPGPPTA